MEKAYLVITKSRRTTYRILYISKDDDVVEVAKDTTELLTKIKKAGLPVMFSPAAFRLLLAEIASIYI